MARRASAIDRLRLVGAHAGPRALLGAMARRGLRPILSWQSVLFFERDLTRGPAPEIRATIPLEVRLAETPEDVGRLEEYFAAIGRRPDDVTERLGRGDRCFVALAEGRLVHFSWLSPGPVACTEIRATLRLAPGELFQGDSFTDRAMRGHTVTGAVMTAIIRWEQAHGYLRHYFYIARDNHSSLGSLGKVRDQRPVLTRTVRCYRVAGSSGVLVTGLDGPARPSLEVATGLHARRVGRLGHWSATPADNAKLGPIRTRPGGLSMATHAITELAIILRPEDDVAIAKRPITAGTVLEDGGHRIEARQDIRPGHKVARRARATGEAVRRYGQVIGFATSDITVGDHVHTHNLGIGELSADRYEIGVDVTPVDFYPPEKMRYFDGYRRDDGRVGTRNYVAIISGVNCSASVSQFVKDRFRDVQKDYPNIDGVLAITHKSGCGTKLFGEDHLALQRVLAGYAKHPNVAAYILVGLGCETNQAAVMVDRQRMAAPGHPERKPFLVNIQEAGGIRKTVETAVAEVAKLLPWANEARRSKQPVSELTLATNCGGSDGNSGITANPALGWALDELVRYGGTGVLAETPEIYGAEHLLIRRAVNEGVAKKLIDRYKWWEWYCRGIDAMDNNPAPGNKAGGITTVFEKSLGGVTKGGTTPMTDVFQYGEPITTRGFVFMDTPGHDPVSITGLVAGGCNLICFTTGRGSVFGCKPVPSIKLATNSLMYRHMEEDMDINCGVILEGTPLPEVGRQIFEEMVAVASGKRSKSELSGVGEEEFAPWIIGPVM